MVVRTTRQSRGDYDSDRIAALARSDSGHVVMFAQPTEIPVQFLHTLLMRFDALSLESLIQLQKLSATAFRHG
jgi:hypothetical protein